MAVGLALIFGSLGAAQAWAVPTPSTVSVTVPSSGAYKAGQTLIFWVQFDEAVMVTGTPGIALTVGSTPRTASYESGSGSTSLKFSYTVAEGDNDSDGIAIGLLSLNGGTIQNAGGAHATLTLNSVGSTSAVTVDAIAPQVSSIVLAGTPAANATLVQFTVSFSEAVSGVFANSLSLTTTGTVTGAVSSVLSSGGIYVVTVMGISGTGTLRLDVSGSSGITDGAGNVVGAYTSGPIHTVAPTITAPGAPTIGTATAGDTEATVTFSPPASTGGAPITTYTVTANPGGQTGTGSSSPITVTGLTNGTPYTFSVTAQNSAWTGPASAASNGVVPAASQTITFPNPGAQTFGTTPTLVATATSGLTPTFTSSTAAICTVSGSGVLAFLTSGTCTIDADQAGSSAYLPAPQVSQSFSVNPTVAGAPTSVVAVPGNGTASVSFVAPANTGGLPITGYTVTSDPSGGTGTGTSSPILVSGLTNGTSYTFKVTAVTYMGAGADSAVSGAVTPGAASLVLTPGSGALPNAMVGEDYSETFTVTGQTGAVTYSWSGATPPGLNLNPATGVLSGSPTMAGSNSFTVVATDAGNNTGSANVTLTLVARAVTAADQNFTVPPGSTPVPVNLVAGATGGPFDSAVIVSVEPSNAGTAQIGGASVAGISSVYPTGIYLHFKPNPQFTGRALITYQLLSALGTSNQAVISFNTTADRDAVAEAFSVLSRNFVTTRAGLLASGIDAPNLRQRRGMGVVNAPGSVSATADGNSATLNFAASSLEMAAFQAIGSATAVPVDTSGVNFWIDGTATLHVRSDGGPDNWGSFALLSGGADVLVDDQLLVGVAVHTDWMEDLTTVSRVDGRGVMVGPYVSAELLDGLFLDASVYYGHSWNTISSDFFGGEFETERLLATARLEGEMALGEQMVLRPSVSVFYLREEAGAYAVRDSLGATAIVDGFVTELVRLSGGGRLEYTLDMGEGVTAVPFGSLQLGLMLTDGSSGAFANLGLGVDLLGIGDWVMGVSTDAGMDSDGLRSISGKARAGVRF